MNIENINALIRHFKRLAKEQGKTYTNMRFWGFEAIIRRNPCQTIGCIAGECCLMMGEQLSSTEIDPPSFAIETLNLTYDQGADLFYFHLWPDKCKEGVKDSENVHVEHIIRRLEYLRDNGE